MPNGPHDPTACGQCAEAEYTSPAPLPFIACPDCGSTCFMSRQGGRGATCIECQGYFALPRPVTLLRTSAASPADDQHALALDERAYAYNHGERVVLRKALDLLIAQQQAEATKHGTALDNTRQGFARRRHVTLLSNAAALRDMATRLRQVLGEK